MEDLPSLQNDPDMNQTWALRRIGQQGMVMLLRAFSRFDKTPRAEPVPAGTIPPMSNAVSNQAKSGVSVISICSLADLVQRASIPLFSSTNDSLQQWHRTGQFYQEESVPNPLSTMTPPSILPSFSSNPSTGEALTTPRPVASFLDSFASAAAVNTDNLPQHSEVKKYLGIAGETPMESVTGKRGSASKGGMLPPISKKRKTLSSNGIVLFPLGAVC